MTINSVSLQTQTVQAIQSAAKDQTALDTLSGQISSGYIASDFAGLGGTASQSSLDLRASSAMIDAYTSVNNTVSTKLSTMATVMSNISSLATTLNSAIITAQNTPGGTASTTLQSTATNVISEITGLLNTQVNGEYLFSGTNTETQPLGSQTAVQSAVTSALSSYTNSSTLSSFSAAVASAVTGSYAGNSGTLSAKIDDNVSVNYGITADNASIQQVLQAAYVVAGLSYNASTSTGYQSILASAASNLNAGQSGVNTLSGQIGTNQELLSSVGTTQSDALTTLSTELGNVEDVNTAQASTKLSSLETQLQASYKIVGALQSLSLVNFISF